MTRAELESAYRKLVGTRKTTDDLQSKAAAILSTRFDKQRALILSKARRRTLLCPRRSGKTETDAGLLLVEALSGPGRICLFVAKTRQRAVDLTYEAVKRLCEKFSVPVKTHDTLARLTFPNGSQLRWVGADDIEALRTKRGDKLWLVVCDEAQDFDFSVLRALIRDIFAPSLEDLGGSMVLSGTPGEVCAGLWYGLTGKDPDPLKREADAELWEHHSWTPLDNPHIPRIHERMASGEMAAEYGGIDSPTYQREWLGRWVRDTGALFYRYSPEVNLYNPDEVQPWGEGWLHVLGWDLGANDDMAVVVWGFNLKRDRGLYEAFSWKKPHAAMDELEALFASLDARFNFVGSAADTGGGGKMFVESFAARYGRHFEPAKKTEKAAHVRLFNDELRAGRIKLRPGSPYAQEIAVLPKVKEWDEAKTGRPAPEDSRFPNHNCDAGLYSWRRAHHYLHEPEVAKPKPGTDEFARAEEERMLEARVQSHRRRQEREWWE